ncbi:hypothetical protein NQ317_012290 [Molorchus minor]|uniref:Uncharacterized protein n=1 Tax=Molorchus minor TaxID=1323400 RepID=A0ABQ9J2Z0_9CUCU|nr:hypothetical protein NQ317_012290 [Molorchus minor]
MKNKYEYNSNIPKIETFNLFDYNEQDKVSNKCQKDTDSLSPEEVNCCLRTNNTVIPKEQLQEGSKYHNAFELNTSKDEENCITKKSLASSEIKSDLVRVNKNTKTTNKRKRMSKLQLNILRQFKEKRKMFRTDPDIAKSSEKNVNSHIDLKSNKKETNNKNTRDRKRKYISELKLNVKPQNKIFEIEANINSVKDESACDVQISNSLGKPILNITEGCVSRICEDKRIHIVQNILIPPNSDYAVDLLGSKKYANLEFAPICDSRLEAQNNSSQYVIPAKKRHKFRDSKKTKVGDILSKIIEEMDKDKPKQPLNVESKTSVAKRDMRGICLQSIHNDFIEDTNIVEPISIETNLLRKPKYLPSKRDKILMRRLLQLSTDENIPDEIILEFSRRKVENIAEMILYKVSEDITEKADGKYYPAPLMTNTQRILLSLMVRLENENIEKLMDTFLTKAEIFLFIIGCGIQAMTPVARLYMAVCRLQANVSRMRMFCCYSFLYMRDLAVPLLFTVLTSWIEIFPMESNLKSKL